MSSVNRSSTSLDEKHSPVNNSAPHIREEVVPDLAKEVAKMKKISASGYQIWLLELGSKILELDNRINSCCMASNTRRILREKRDGLIHLYAKLKSIVNKKNLTRHQLEELEIIIAQCGDKKAMNVFCYRLGTFSFSLFTSAAKTDTLQLIHALGRSINQQVNSRR